MSERRWYHRAVVGATVLASLASVLPAHRYWTRQGVPESVPVLLGANLFIVSLVAVGYVVGTRAS